MFTASVTNTNLIIYSGFTITGFNSSLLYVFNNNSFSTFNFISSSALTITLGLNFSVQESDEVSLRIYSGGITTTSPNLSTSFNAQNNTIYFDPSSPTLFEVIEEKNYSFTSFIYYNLSASNGNFPSASLTIKRNPPTGKVTINEGFEGPMNVRRFAAMSSNNFLITGSASSSFPTKFAFNYKSYGNHTISSVLMPISSLTGILSSKSLVNLTIKNDYFSNPGSLTLGISSTIDLVNLSTQPSSIIFSFSPPITLQQGTYWFIFSPTTSSSIPSSTRFGISTASANNFYSTVVKQTQDNVTFTAFSLKGVGDVTLVTERGIVLPSQDFIYNQLDQIQSTTVSYGDETNPNLYTQIALPTASHYIKKILLDKNVTPVAIEILAQNNQGGGNRYAFYTQLDNVKTQFLSMIANQYTTNIIRFNFTDTYSPNIYDFYLGSQGDYYASNTVGNVLVSASDALGIDKIELSPSSLFPTQSTVTLSPGGLQQYISNITNFDFGNISGKFSNFITNLGASYQYLFSVLYQGEASYLAIGIHKIIIIDVNENIVPLYEVNDADITFAGQGVNEFVFFDSKGKIYGINSSFVVYIKTSLSFTEIIPVSGTLSNNIFYVGVAQIADAPTVQSRIRIYSLQGNALTHLAWSTNIPEPQITYLYNSFIYGLFIAAYSQINDDYVGKLYYYSGSNLKELYSTFLRIDYVFISESSEKIYLGLSSPEGGFFSGCQIIVGEYDSELDLFVNFSDTGVSISGNQVFQLNDTKIENQILFITDQASCLFDETTYAVTELQNPTYSLDDQPGLLTTIENNNLKITNFNSTFTGVAYSNINYDPYLQGFGNNFTFTASGKILFEGASSTSGYSTSLFLQYPQQNSYIEAFVIDGKTIDSNPFTVTVKSNLSPVDFYLSIKGSNLTGLGTIALRNGLTSFASIVGISSFVAPKNLNYFYKTGAENDLFVYSDGVIREANLFDLTSNVYSVFARFTDSQGNVTQSSDYVSDTIFSQKQQQINGTQVRQGSIYEINPIDKSFVKKIPPSGAQNFIYAGSKNARATAFFESDPFFASDVTSWGNISVLCFIPGRTYIENLTGITSGAEWGTSVTLYVATSATLEGLSNSYFTQFSETTINNNLSFANQVASISGDLTTLNGQWLKFKLVLNSASKGITPKVKSVYITYFGAGNSVFITKSFDTAVQGKFSVPPTVKRGILTANFVTNGGEINFYYTTDANNTDIRTYTEITPNQIFTLPTPSSKIKFGAILKSATSTPCFLDDFGVQLDLGQDGNIPQDVYYMPPQSGFAVTAYYDETGARVPWAYQFINKTVGIVSNYNWSFGTTYPVGILSFLSSGQTPGVATVNQTNPIVVFTHPGPFVVGLTVTGFVQNGVIFNSEPFLTIVTASAS